MIKQSLVTGKTNVYGIVGFPVSHSLSPVMQNAALADAGVDGIYVPFSVSPEQLSAAVSGLRALHVRGFNVTIPHKAAIMPLLDELAPSALDAGAVNTVHNSNGCLIGHNTDGDGLLAAIRQELDYRVAGANVIVIGAGGAARGALAALCAAGVRSVTVINRTRAAAEMLIGMFQSKFPKTGFQAIGFAGDLSRCLPETDLLINASSLGMAGEKIAGVSLALLPCHARVYDMVYAPASTPLLEEARQRGLKASNGLSMLVAQGERAFEIWHGRPPRSGMMRAALQTVYSG